MEKNMETTIMGYIAFRVKGLVFRAQGQAVFKGCLSTFR